MDTMSKKQRHNNMAAIHSKDTKPELIVSKYLFAHGFRYRLNLNRLPGHPDIVLRKYRTCIFVNGCFWHGHTDCRYFRLPTTNRKFWTDKIERNRTRDIRDQKRLADMGWHCITVWECELKPGHREATLESLCFTLNHIFLKDHSISISRPQPYAMPQEEPQLAAEPQPDGYKSPDYEHAPHTKHDAER